VQFHPELILAMKEGVKTQTRRVKHPQEVLIPYHRKTLTPAVVRALPRDIDITRWVVGRRYAIQEGRGQKAIGSFECIGLREELLQDISENDCIAEGIIAQVTFYWNSDVMSWVNPLDTNFVFDGPFISPVGAFAELWNGTQNLKGRRWWDNPVVFIIEMGEFEWK
jgi:hypothetical protein